MKLVGFGRAWLKKASRADRQSAGNRRDRFAERDDHHDLRRLGKMTIGVEVDAAARMMLVFCRS